MFFPETSCCLGVVVVKRYGDALELRYDTLGGVYITHGGIVFMNFKE